MDWAPVRSSRESGWRAAHRGKCSCQRALLHLDAETAARSQLFRAALLLLLRWFYWRHCLLPRVPSLTANPTATISSIIISAVTAMVTAGNITDARDDLS